MSYSTGETNVITPGVPVKNSASMSGTVDGITFEQPTVTAVSPDLKNLVVNKSKVDPLSRHKF